MAKEDGGPALRTCSRAGCRAKATRGLGNARYCSPHYRFATMRTKAKADGKAVPTWEQLEALLTKNGMVCKPCGRTMNWHAKDGADTVLTLQHDRSGAFRFICLSCNTRHAAQPGDSFYDIPQGSRRCSKCLQVKPESDFYGDASGRWNDKKSTCKTCSDGALANYRENNREAYNAAQRDYRARRKAAGNPVKGGQSK